MDPTAFPMRGALVVAAVVTALGARLPAAAQDPSSLAADALLSVGQVTVVGGSDRNAAQMLSESFGGVSGDLARCIAPAPRPGTVTPTRASRPVNATVRLRFDATGVLLPTGVRVTGRGVAPHAAECVARVLAGVHAPAANVTAATAALRAQWAIIYEGPRALEEPRTGPGAPPDVTLRVSVAPVDGAGTDAVTLATRILHARASVFRACLTRHSQLGGEQRATYFIAFGPDGAAQDAQAERSAGPEAASACLLSVLRRVRLTLPAGVTLAPTRVRVQLLYDVTAATSVRDAPREPPGPRNTNRSGGLL